MYKEIVFHVFLSHNSKDKPNVRKLAKALKERNLQVWLDEEQLIPGHPWQEALEKIIQTSQAAAVLIGKDGIGPWQDREMRSCISQFVDRGSPVIPILLPGVSNTPELPLFLKQYTWVDLREGLTKQGIDRVVWGITGTKPNSPSISSTLSATIGKDISIKVEAESKADRLFSVPELPPHYLLRIDQHKRIVNALGKNKSEKYGTNKLGLYGMGGIGKTVTASALARDARIRQQFPDGIYWLTIGIQPVIPVLQSQLSRYAESNRVCQDSLEWKYHLTQLFAEKKCLLVLDDVWDAEHVREFDVLNSFSRIVITTREGSVLTALGAEEQQLNVLTNEESLWLLSEWCGQPKSTLDGQAIKVAQECGNLPLALSVCGAMVRDGIPWGDILDALQEADLSFLEHSDLKYTYPNVFRALKISVEFLASKIHGADTRYIELGVFPKDTPIQEEAILTLWCADGEMKEREARKLLAILARKALLSITGISPKRLIILHDLQHDFIHNQYET